MLRVSLMCVWCVCVCVCVCVRVLIVLLWLLTIICHLSLIFYLLSIMK